MKKLTADEIEKGYKTWYSHYKEKDSNQILHSVLNDQLRAYAPGKLSWLRLARKGLFQSPQVIDYRLQVSRQAYAKYEESEINGTITLRNLARAAEAMNCELVYGIRPKSQRLFCHIIWEKLFERVGTHGWLGKCDQKRRGDALGYLAKELMNNPKFRKEQGWSQRANG